MQESVKWLLGTKKPGHKTGLSICSPDWTRTSNPSINSRMLCQLSYGGMLFALFPSLQRVITLHRVFVVCKSRMSYLNHTLVLALHFAAAAEFEGEELLLDVSVGFGVALG